MTTMVTDIGTLIVPSPDIRGGEPLSLCHPARPVLFSFNVGDFRPYSKY
jgi:hypothetical protein